MSFKKILVSGVVVLASVAGMAVFADNVDVDQAADEDAAPLFQSSVYVDAHVGYTQVNWRTFNGSGVMGISGASYFSPTDHGKGGVTGGVDTGYNFSKYIAGEAGWLYLPEVKGSGTGSGTAVSFTSSQTAKVHSWLLYGAAKFSVPMVKNMQLFGKVGAAYRSLTYTVPSNSNTGFNAMTKAGGYWAPVFAAGMQYTRNGWLLGFQYLHLPGNKHYNSGVAVDGAVINGGPDSAPEVNMYTAYLGYQYSA